MSIKKVMALVGTLVCFSPISSYAATNYVSGNISNITSLPGALLIMLNTGVPSNCSGAPAGWMMISEANKTMISVALTMWASGKTAATVYTNAYTGTGYCEINQLDPMQ